MQIFPHADTTDASGFDQMNLSPANDAAERAAVFSDIMSRQGSTGGGTDSAGTILGYAREGMQQAEKSITGAAKNVVGTAKSLGNQGLKTGLASMSRLKAVMAAANNPSGKKGKQVDFTLAAAQQTIKDFTSMKPLKGDTPQSLKMTLQDWNGLKQDLLKHGLNEADLNDLEARIGSKTGMNWGEFVHFLNGSTGFGTPTIEFSAEDKQGLASFFSQLGFTTGESEGLIRNLSGRQYGDVFKAISGRINTLAENGESASIGRGELESLLSALKLSKNASSRLKGLLGNKDEFSLGELNRAMSAAQKDLMLNRGAKKADDAELAELVGKALKKALDNNAGNLQSNRHGDDSAEKRIASKAGISKDILENRTEQARGDETAKDSIASKDMKDAPGATGEETLFARLGKGTEKNDAVGVKTEKNLKNPMQQFAERIGNKADDGHKSGEELFEDGSDSEMDKSWKEFFGRLKVDNSAGSRTAPALDSIMDEALAAAGKGEASRQSVETGRTKDNFSSRTLFDQINNGVFKNLGQGRRQLTLQLKPEDLGTLNVVLQVRNKEVRALIKTDNPEATRLVGEQLEAIKQSLQEQGLKVSKLDVQTSTAGNHGNSDWQGESGHNKAMEQDEMAQTLSRWRNLKGEGDSLAREMQNSDVRENISHTGLHIVA